MCAALVSSAASGEAVNVPRASVPFACSARRPACLPNTSLQTSMTRLGVTTTADAISVQAVGSDPALARVEARVRLGEQDVLAATVVRPRGGARRRADA